MATPTTQTEKDLHYKLWMSFQRKVNTAPVDKYGGAKNQEKVDEYARKAAFHEAEYRKL